ncbi:hypothetical protein [Streptomyces sp. NPDC002537]
MRKALRANVLGAASVITAACAVSVAAAAPALADEVPPPSAVETFDYPHADKILKEQGIALYKGDGHILLADCASSSDIVVATRHNKEGKYCFKVTGSGKSGYLSLEIPGTFNIMTKDYAVQAKLTADSQVQTVDVPRNGFKSVGEAANPPGAPTALTELRITG